MLSLSAEWGGGVQSTEFRVPSKEEGGGMGRWGDGGEGECKVPSSEFRVGKESAEWKVLSAEWVKECKVPSSVACTPSSGVPSGEKNAELIVRKFSYPFFPQLLTPNSHLPISPLGTRNSELRTLQALDQHF
uniref:Uncharacterized protein n=1 Tax=Desertifilum tharense IPPAS B-1220 TaxID=1781255 RepID=A0A1E5QE32_9CYAN|nr:hypothetical protein BH720_22455 [Desertifilum tharense IPPAS B-1220]